MKKHYGALMVSLLAVSVILTAAQMASAQSDNPSFSGQAVGVKATVVNLPPIDLSDTGPLPSSGGANQASLLSASVPIINIDCYGNTTAGTVPLAMDTARQEGRLKKG